MDRNSWLQKKEERERAALEWHKRISRLYREDRFAFERERRRMIEDVIRQADPSQQESLRAIQAKWDRRMKGAGSIHNRLVLAQTFFWEHFHEKWQPALARFSNKLNR